MRLIIRPEVVDYFLELADILYEKGYFGFEDAAVLYAKELFQDIQKTLPVRLHKPAPSYYDRHGKNMYYALFRKNKRTTWYAFFNKYEENRETIYLVCYMGNNHTDAQHL